MNIRKTAFNIVDKLQGNIIGEHIKDIKQKMEHKSKTYPQKSDVDNFLKHACDTTEFYKQYKGTTLQQFPIVNKPILKENYKYFISDRYDESELVKVTTSGSYGTPFTYLLTKEKKKRQQAEVIYFGKLANYDVGIKHAYARVTKSKSKLKLFLQNQLLIDPTNMNIDWFARYRNELKKGYKVIIGYPSTITALAKYCLKKGDSSKDFSLQGVITTAEPLLQDQRKVLAELFGCPIVNRYSTEEFGVVANSCSEGNLHLNRATFKVELLDDNGKEVKPDEIGRIVITDLYSHALPLIRYDIGDLGKYKSGCTCGYEGKVLTSVLGRQIETIYNTMGEYISPFALNGAMRDLDGILQFQFIQEGKDSYRLLIVPLENYISSTEEIIKRRFLDILGNDAKFEIEKVNDIPPFNSGKRPYIIQKYRKE